MINSTDPRKKSSHGPIHNPCAALCPGGRGHSPHSFCLSPMPSRAPAASSFQDALSVDEEMIGVSADDHADSKALREEPDEVYYARIFNEYVAAKASLGDPTDHIKSDAFIARIRLSENETGAKHGKPVRYKVEVRGKEVVLLAVPLG